MLAGCVQEAKGDISALIIICDSYVHYCAGKGWNGGVMVWEFPDADSKWIHAVRATAFPVSGGPGPAAAKAPGKPGKPKGPTAPGAPRKPKAFKGRGKPKAPKAPGGSPKRPGQRRTLRWENFDTVY